MKFLATILLAILFLASCAKKTTKTTKTVVEADVGAGDEVGQMPEAVEKPFAEADQNMVLVNKRYQQIKDSLLNEIKSKDKKAYSQALIADRVTHDFVIYVQGIKETLELVAHKYGKEDIEHSKKLMIEESKAKELKGFINKTRQALLATLTAEEQKEIETDLIAENPSKSQTWEAAFFEHTPVIAAIAFVQKIKLDAANTSTQVIKKLLERANKK